MNILFVCTANKFRSKTAETLFRSHSPHHEYKSCGTSEYMVKKHGGTFVSTKLLIWADKIVCMDKDHKWFIENWNPRYKHKITCLNIPDIYKYMDEDLIHELKSKVDFA